MKNSRTMIMSALLVIAAAGSASAQTATQDLTINISAINKIAVDGGAHTLTINTATAGNAPDAQSWTTTWAITTNQDNMKVTASIGSAMPSETVLQVELGEPTAATPAGVVTLDNTAKTVVSGISKLSESGLDLTYTVSATAAAGVQSIARTVTYTITSGA